MAARPLSLAQIAIACWLIAGAARAQEEAPTVPAAVPDAPAAPATPAPVFETVNVVLHTAQGDIRVAIETQRAPITARNFLRYVDQKRFDNITFYRAVKVDDEGKYGLVQGGLISNPKLVFPAIAHEPPGVTGLSHLDGAISMAHSSPGTARADFFIVVGDLVSLDGNGTPADPGYAVFGRVTEGMDLVRQIMVMPRSDAVGNGSMQGQMLASPVKVLTVRRAK